MKKVLFFGMYNTLYSRNRVLIKGFKENGYEVIECRVDPTKYKGVLKFFKLISEYRAHKKDQFEHVIVAFPGHTVVWLAYLLYGRTFIFDAFLSLYDSNVSDRKKYTSFSFSAFKDFFLDWYSIRLARFVLLDTNAHIEYFHKMFGLNPKKAVSVLVSADDSVFVSQMEVVKNLTEKTVQEEKEGQTFKIHFHGSFIPLQGIDYIVETVDLLKNENITLNLIGKGQELKRIQEKVTALNLQKIVHFIDPVTYESLPSLMRNADVCLGIFGKSDKTLRVIPNKLYEAVALGLPIITADTPAVREVFTENDTMLFCEAGDVSSLAEKILWVKNNRQEARRIAMKAHQLFVQTLIPRKIVSKLLATLSLK